MCRLALQATAEQYQRGEQRNCKRQRNRPQRIHVQELRNRAAAISDAPAANITHIEENRDIAGVLMSVQGYSISIYGYTDDVGTAEYNVKLSERRAQAVRDYLVQSGLDPKIITTKGFGKSDPRVHGDSAADRAANRRVEIGLVNTTLRLEGLAP